MLQPYAEIVKCQHLWQWVHVHIFNDESSFAHLVVGNFCCLCKSCQGSVMLEGDQW